MRKKGIAEFLNLAWVKIDIDNLARESLKRSGGGKNKSREDNFVL